MSMQGWDHTMWQTPVPHVVNTSLCSSLAGNASNGFVMVAQVAQVAGMMSSYGHMLLQLKANPDLGHIDSDDELQPWHEDEDIVVVDP